MIMINAYASVDRPLHARNARAINIRDRLVHVCARVSVHVIAMCMCHCIRLARVWEYARVWIPDMLTFARA